MNSVSSLLRRMGILIAVFAVWTQAIAQSPASPPKRSQADLETLLGPIALYPDPLLSIVLPASCYPLEIVEAARFVANTNNIPKIDEQPWDVNVKSVAKIPAALAKLNADLTWTSNLGQAFLDQQKEVMDTIQILRNKAQAAGTLKTSEQQIVIVTNMVTEKTIETKVVVVTNNDSAYAAAFNLARAGIAVTLADSRPNIAGDLASRAAAAGVALFPGTGIADVEGAKGVAAVKLAGAHAARIECDALGMSGGWSPTVHLSSHGGIKPRFAEALAAFVPGGFAASHYGAGAMMGTFGLAAAIAEGAAAGAKAASHAGYTKTKPVFAPDDLDDQAYAIDPEWAKSKPAKGKAFVDFQNDVTASDVALAHREGFRSVEHLKRYTTLGMATDQGKTSSVNGLAMLAALTGRDIETTGVTRARPPERPVSFGALAGHHRGKHLKPTRLTPSHRWAAEQGAVFVETGPWLRAQWYPRPGEKTWLDSVKREAAAVRAGVGICDVSTLGKIALFGHDVGTFLDRVYCNTFSTLAVGRARYGLMLREDGFVMDDGTTARLGEDEWVMTTTTVNAAKVMQHLEFARQVLWPGLDVRLASVTEQWAQVAVAGPNARRLLERLLGDIPNEAVPYLAARAFDLGGVPARLFRLSFSGELAYEIAVPAQYGDALMRELMRAGADLGVTPYGTEALGVLRVEKGHVAGNELNGQTTARDLGLAKMMSAKKDYVGRTLAGRPALIDPERPQLAGFMAADPAKRIRAGAHLLRLGAAERPENDQGYLTSAVFSPALGRWIALGLLSRGPERIGERLRAYDKMQGGDLELEICAPVFFDPEGARLHV